MGAVVDAYVRAALSRGMSSLYSRLAEITLDMEAHEMEIARLTVERDALAERLKDEPAPNTKDQDHG